MRFAPWSSPGFIRSLIPLVLVTILSAGSSDEVAAAREAEGTSSRGPDARGYRVVATAPGVEIRADERAWHTYVPVGETGEPFASGETRWRDFALTTESLAAPAWRPLPLYGGTPVTIAVSPIDPNLVLAGVGSRESFAGGLFESRDGGATWSAVQFTSDVRLTRYVEDIEFGADGTAYVATEYSLVKRDRSTGAWTAIVQEQYRYYREVGLNPGNPDEIWLAGYNSLGAVRYFLRRSRDAGVTWEDVRPAVGPDMSCVGIAFKTADPRVIVAAFSFNGGQLWRSLDGGDTWTRQSTSTSNYTDVVYDGTYFIASAEWLSSAGVFLSTNDGLTWGRVNNGQWPSNQVYDLDVDPRRPGVCLASTARGLVRYRDGIWAPTGGVLKELRSACLFPGDPDRLLVGALGEGILRSIDGGMSFSQSSTGMLALDVYSLACNPRNVNEIAAAFQTANAGGVYVSRDGGRTWEIQNLLPARYDALEYAPDGTLYVAHRGPTTSREPEGVYRRNPNGSWTALGPFGTAALLEADVMCIRVNPTDPGHLIVSGSYWPDDTFGIWRSTDAGAHWSRVYTGLDESYAAEIQFVNDGSGKRVLATVPLGGALHSDDGGATWAPVTGIAGNARGSYLRGTPSDPGTFYLAGYYRPNAYRTRDGGKTWSPFQVANGVSSIEVDRSNPDILYAASMQSFTVVRSQDGGNQFSSFTEGIPVVFGSDFAWVDAPCPTLLYANRQGVYAREIDAVAPQISLELEPRVLWPPDHKLRTITARVTTSDACDASPSVVLSSITMSDGSSADVVANIGEGTITFQLRAERSGKGERRYLVTYTSTDASGNARQASATVLVPHDQSQAALAGGGEYSRAGAPAKTELVGIEPNPFNPSTAAMITLAGAQRVTLDVYDVRGARVRRLEPGLLPAGTHRIAWDGTDQSGRSVASGVYFFRFAAGDHVQTMKALLVK